MSHHKHFLKPFQIIILRLLTLPLFFLILYTIYGYINDYAVILKFYPEAPAIVPITFICFILVFAAEWTLLGKRRPLTVTLAGLLLFISVYFLIKNFYYPQSQDYTSTNSFSHPFLQPFSNEVCFSFLCIGLILLVLSAKKLRTFHLVTSSMLLWIPLSIAQLSLLYFIFYHPGLSTKENLSMPLITTIGFFMTVIFFATFILFHVVRLYPTAFSRWFILTCILISTTGGYAIWHSAKNLESSFFCFLSSQMAEDVQNSLLDYINNRQNNLSTSVFFLDHPTEDNEGDWKRENSIFMGLNPEIELIIGYVPEKKTFWEVNKSGSSQKIEQLHKLLEKNPNQNFIVDDLALSPTFIITNRKPGSETGWMAISIDVNTLISQLSKRELHKKAGLAITWKNSLLYFESTDDQKYRLPYGSMTSLTISHPPIVMEVWPTEQQYQSLKTPLPNVILSAEIFALILTSLILYYAELARIRSDQYKKAEQEKTAFFANISHEIRTQLQGIMGTGSILERTSLSEKQQRMVNIIKASGTVLQRLLNDLLDLTKFEMGRMKLDPQPTAISQSVKEVTTLMTPKAEEKGLKIQLKIDPNLPHIIYIDNDRFQQILSNLLSNAIKFTHEGSVTVAITTNIMEDSNRRMLILKVSDTGIGIPADSLKRIFEKFYQVRTARNDSIEGTGLGLPISRMLTEYMGGTITCESEPDKGSTFTVVIPVLIEEQKKKPDDKL